MVVVLVCRPGLTDLLPSVTEELIQNQSFDWGLMLQVS